MRGTRGSASHVACGAHRHPNGRHFGSRGLASSPLTTSFSHPPTRGNLRVGRAGLARSHPGFGPVAALSLCPSLVPRAWCLVRHPSMTLLHGEGAGVCLGATCPLASLGRGRRRSFARRARFCLRSPRGPHPTIARWGEFFRDPEGSHPSGAPVPRGGVADVVP